jgi:hypothetical protein
VPSGILGRDGCAHWQGYSACADMSVRFPCFVGCHSLFDHAGLRMVVLVDPLIKSYVSRCGCSIDNCSRHNNLTIKRPAWTVFKSVGKVGEIERHLIAKDTKRTQRDQHGRSEHDAGSCLGFDGVARVPCPRPLPERPMTARE